MEPHIQKMLEKEKHPDNIQTLLNDLKKWTKISRGKMKTQFGKWDRNLRIFNGMRWPDESDMDARNNDEPSKMTVPMSYTQVMTFVTFCYMLFRQNPTFFVMMTQRNDDYSLQEICEDFLERDLRHNQWPTILFQILLDIGRMGVACTKCVWKTETQWVKLPVPVQMSFVNQGPFSVAQGEQPSFEMVPQEVMRYEGNQVIHVSPFKMMPDMRLPLTRWKEGMFFADEYEYHIQYLKELERKGVVVGTKYLTRMDSNVLRESGREYSRMEGGEPAFGPGVGAGTQSPEDFMVVTTEGQFKIVPKDYGLGPEDYLCDYIICYANDQRVVKIEKCEYLHGEFIYDLSQFTPDVHQRLNRSLSDSINALQDVITWLINARVMSVRRGLSTHAVVDPSAIDMSSAEARSPIYFVKKGSPRIGLDKFFMQLKYTDPTVTHFQDAETLTGIMEQITGVNKNAMGQYAPGRRSASENRSANQGAASRMSMHASLIWEGHMSPLGRKMLSNLRQGVSMDTFTKVLGTVSPNSGIDLQSAYAQFCPEDITQLVGNEDFFTFDGTTSSDRQFIAQTLQEMFDTIMSNPEMNQVLRYDPNKLADQILFYKGIRNESRLKLPGGAFGQPVGVVPPVPGQGPPGAGGPGVAAGGVPGQVPGLQGVQEGLPGLQGGGSGGNAGAGPA